MFRGLSFHVWEYHDDVWGAETNIYEAGRSIDVEGDYEAQISREILSWRSFKEYRERFEEIPDIRAIKLIKI